jgi:beta-N-acetylhexosaminidase
MRKYLIWFVFLAAIAFVVSKAISKVNPEAGASLNTETVVAQVVDPAQDAQTKQKIGQMLIVGFRGMSVTASSSIVKTINDLNIGGVLLFDYDASLGKYERNIKNKKQLTSLVSNLKANTKDIFVSIDLEGGAVNRLKSKYGFADFPSAQTLGKKDDLVFTESVGKKIGAELSGAGFNMDFAPDVDVNINPKNPVIGGVGRSYSSDPAKVVAHAQAFIKGLHSQNIISVIKHFPGHGSSTADSHVGFVDVTKTYKSAELIPFAALASSTDAVMVAHVVNKKVDPKYPATLSPLFIKNILRDQMGYKGVVISDDMSMGAITKNYSLEDSVVRAINAGNDILIVSNNGTLIYNENLPYKVSTIILNAVHDGRISIDTINSANARIQKLKSDFKI